MRDILNIIWIEIIKIKNKQRFTAVILAAIYTFLFQKYFIQNPNHIYIYVFIGMIFSFILSKNFPKNIDKKFYKRLFINLSIWIFIGFISILITDFGFICGFIGLFLSTGEKSSKDEFSFKDYAWRQFKKNKIALVSLYILIGLIFMALFAPYLANDAPLYAEYQECEDCEPITIYPAYELERHKRSTEISIEKKREIIQEVENLGLSEEEAKNTIQEKIDQAKAELMPKLIHPITKEKISYAKIDWKKWADKEWINNVTWAPITYSPGTHDLINSDYKHPNKYKNYDKLKNQLEIAYNKKDKSLIVEIEDKMEKEQKYISYNNDDKPDGDTISIPNRYRHVLGTGPGGRDLASGIIHGTRISLYIGIFSMGIAALIGIILGALAGFFADDRLKMRRIKYYFTIIGLFFGIYYGYGTRKYIISDSFSNEASSSWEILLTILIIIGCIIAFRLLSRIITNKWLNQEISIPVDSFVSRGIELLNSIPRLLLIITVSAVMKEKSLVIIFVIIGLTSWTGIARFTRAELLRIRNLEYVQASTALGFSSVRTIFKHALPNALAPVFVSIAFGIASAILIESSLSFLNIGVPAEAVTWGSLLNLGREYPEAWWLIMYPGFAIFITITVYNMIAEASRDALDPKLKN